MGFNEEWRVTFSIINALFTPVLIRVIWGKDTLSHLDYPRPLLLFTYLLCLIALSINVHLNMLNFERTFKTNRRLFLTIFSCSIFMYSLFSTLLGRVILYSMITKLFLIVVIVYFVVSSLIVFLIHMDFQKNQNTVFDTEMTTIERIPE
ncbi:uncharacterized protein LOC117570462 [Drosophila albomicans]|uniref:Uncharacterized protein LOC117570462 n=1 Tax=Drosophila albomicans TaxID=7291 RepID=A0A6P8X9N1_DROAB|nr:uncharacterized protein LOC117570462 [Drosophila albomicans]